MNTETTDIVVSVFIGKSKCTALVNWQNLGKLVFHHNQLFHRFIAA